MPSTAVNEFAASAGWDGAPCGWGACPSPATTTVATGEVVTMSCRRHARKVRKTLRAYEEVLSARRSARRRPARRSPRR